MDSQLWSWLWVQEMTKRIANQKSRLACGQSRGGCGVGVGEGSSLAMVDETW